MDSKIIYPIELRNVILGHLIKDEVSWFRHRALGHKGVANIRVDKPHELGLQLHL